MYTLKYENEIILENEDIYSIYKYIHSNHAYSVSYAMEYAWYTVEKDGKDITREFILK